jgi:hypothetical protein
MIIILCYKVRSNTKIYYLLKLPDVSEAVYHNVSAKSSKLLGYTLKENVIQYKNPVSYDTVHYKGG